MVSPQTTMNLLRPESLTLTDPTNPQYTLLPRSHPILMEKTRISTRTLEFLFQGLREKMVWETRWENCHEPQVPTLPLG